MNDLKRIEKPSETEAYACNADVAQALDFFSEKCNPGNLFATFIVEARYVRHENIECEYCTSPATWYIARYPK